MPAAASSDEDLMLAYAAGDAAAFDTLYARHKGSVYRYLLRQCRESGVVDELFQDVWMNLIRSRATYAPTAKFTTWLYRLAHNRLIDHYRASGHLTLVSADDDAHEEMVAALPGARSDQPEVRAENRELGERLRAAVAALPPAQREAFLLQQEAGLSLADIAAVTGVGTETVKSRLRYAVGKLRDDLVDLDDDLRENLG
jgi:RNA polymerase sigma-70 factor, ECF subfamily